MSFSRQSNRLVRRRDGWLAEAVCAGFVATVLMSLVLVTAYLVADALGSPGGSLLGRWFWALAHNPVVDLTSGSLYALIGLHLLSGIFWAVLFAAYFDPRLPGNSWQRGALFGLIPWAVSLLIFLPAAGAGILGLALGAGPLPILGNLILHLVYGATLGLLYQSARGPVEAGEGDVAEEIAEQLASMLRAQHGTATGIGAGAVIGLVLGFAFGTLVPIHLVPAATAGLTLTGLVIGAAAGGLVGSLAAIYQDSPNPRPPLN